ncbi:flagellar transcriptional regulator FlhD [Cupriavidus numazuensis]|uniref:Flagellar transcriptional regulator FlhD n=1 Tax=Cupriavidus numazuensis TaxID=221992 RepID=A0ABM8TV33_9BURK|nr:flagellar transcriptional regulator FlhD [Cupriavidus numazuensis]CAG2160495.1 Flagellar transcriptional regulator FlhD [Cupriavidus numazuensis]
MISNDCMNAISEFNLSYLLLAQRMIQDNEAEGMFRLGISEEIARLIAALTPAQLIKLSRTNILLCRFRFDDHVLLSSLAAGPSQHDLQQMQMAILLSAQPVEAIN